MSIKARRPAGTATLAGPHREAESLGVQLCAAVGYAVVVITILISVLGTFSDDLGLGQAAILTGPAVLLSLGAIKWRCRMRAATYPSTAAPRDSTRPNA